jgi:hypothetical protein
MTWLFAESANLSRRQGGNRWGQTRASGPTETGPGFEMQWASPNPGSHCIDLHHQLLGDSGVAVDILLFAQFGVHTHNGVGFIDAWF